MPDEVEAGARGAARRMVVCCQFCRWVQPVHVSVVGRVLQCHRWPPLSTSGEWPSVLPSDWCGEVERDDHRRLGHGGVEP